MSTLSAPLHSPEWYRVAPLRLRLRAGVTVSRQPVRGQVWHVLTDPVSGRHHRFNDSAYRFISGCDGQRTLDEVWSMQLAADGDAAPTQAEAIHIVAQAYAAQILIGNVAPDAAALVKKQARADARRKRSAANPLAFRVPLWDPDRFLARHLSAVRALLGPAARTTGWAVAAAGLLWMVLNASELGRDTRVQLESPRLLLLMWLAYPLLKALHELAHAFMVKVHGGHVHEIGVTLMMLTPVPYVDASAATAFAGKRERIAVSAAGILVEAIAASVALAGWSLLEPGLARQACLAVAVVGGVSTLLVNGNPLMRYDGYHVLCDALELPNLAVRSARWWTLALQRTVLRMPQAQLEALARGETPWLMAYAPLAWVWRVVLLATIAVALAHTSTALGIGLIIFAAWAAVGQPLLAGGRWVWASPQAGGQRLRAGLALAAAGTLGAVLLFAVPLPERTQAPAVVWLPDDAVLRAHSDARVEEFLVADGTQVEPGMPVVRLSNEELLADLARVRAEFRSAEIERLQRFETDAARSAVADDDVRRLSAEVARLQDQADHLLVRAASAGRAVITEPQRSVGRWVPQGEILAQVLPPGAPIVRALVGNDDIALVRDRPGDIQVTLAHGQGETLAATLRHAVPRATFEMPTAALGDAAGGPVAIDRSDPSGRIALEPRFVFDLALPVGTPARVGARAMVTFVHGHASAADWLARAGRQAFLRHFVR